MLTFSISIVIGLIIPKDLAETVNEQGDPSQNQKEIKTNEVLGSENDRNSPSISIDKDHLPISKSDSEYYSRMIMSGMFVSLSCSFAAFIDGIVLFSNSSHLFWKSISRLVRSLIEAAIIGYLMQRISHKHRKKYRVCVYSYITSFPLGTILSMILESTLLETQTRLFLTWIGYSIPSGFLLYTTIYELLNISFSNPDFQKLTFAGLLLGEMISIFTIIY